MVGVGPNLMSLMTVRLFQEHSAASARSLERLATGRRINRSGDDPSGMIASENLGAQSLALRKEIDRLKTESFTLGAREGALSVVSDLMQDLNGLVVAAASRGAMGDDEARALQGHADGIIGALRHVYGSTRFLDKLVFQSESVEGLGRIAWSSSGPDGEAPGSGKEISVADLAEGRELNLVDGDMEAAQAVVQAAIGQTSASRAALGTQQSIFYQRQISALERELEGTDAARSKIRDTDYATEVTQHVRSQVLAEAAAAIIRIVQESSARTVLGLLAGGMGRAA